MDGVVVVLVSDRQCAHLSGLCSSSACSVFGCISTAPRASRWSTDKNDKKLRKSDKMQTLPNGCTSPPRCWPRCCPSHCFLHCATASVKRNGLRCDGPHSRLWPWAMECGCGLYGPWYWYGFLNGSGNGWCDGWRMVTESGRHCSSRESENGSVNGNGPS